MGFYRKNVYEKYDQKLTITDTENLVYRKKYVDIKN